MMINAVQHASRPALHVRLDGRSYGLSLSQLQLSVEATDQQIRRTVEGHLGLMGGALARHVVVRHEHAIVVRPEAIYG